MLSYFRGPRLSLTFISHWRILKQIKGRIIIVILCRISSCSTQDIRAGSLSHYLCLLHNTLLCLVWSTQNSHTCIGQNTNILSCRFTFCFLHFFPIHSICPIIRYFSLSSCLVRSLFLLCFLSLLLLLLSGLCKDVRLHHLPQLLLRPLQPLHLIALHPPLVQL